MHASAQFISNFSAIYFPFNLVCRDAVSSRISSERQWADAQGFPWSQILHSMLSECFRLHSFRPGQLEAINCVSHQTRFFFTNFPFKSNTSVSSPRDFASRFSPETTYFWSWPQALAKVSCVLFLYHFSQFISSKLIRFGLSQLPVALTRCLPNGIWPQQNHSHHISSRRSHERPSAA